MAWPRVPLTQSSAAARKWRTASADSCKLFQQLRQVDMRRARRRDRQRRFEIAARLAPELLLAAQASQRQQQQVAVARQALQPFLGLGDAPEHVAAGSPACRIRRRPAPGRRPNARRANPRSRVAPRGNRRPPSRRAPFPAPGKAGRDRPRRAGASSASSPEDRRAGRAGLRAGRGCGSALPAPASGPGAFRAAAPGAPPRASCRRPARRAGSGAARRCGALRARRNPEGRRVHPRSGDPRWRTRLRSSGAPPAALGIVPAARRPFRDTRLASRMAWAARHPARASRPAASAVGGRSFRHSQGVAVAPFLKQAPGIAQRPFRFPRAGARRNSATARGRPGYG
jgi:hypothetical protein